MSRTISKFPLDEFGVTKITVPRTARVVLVGNDPAATKVAIWLEFDTATPKVERRFLKYATGAIILGDGGFPTDIHVGSVIDEYGDVWHVYEERR